MPSNSAAWILEPKTHPFQVQDAPTWKPEENEILVKHHAVAINPVDGSIQTTAWWPLDYPAILGHDVAGEVIQVGPKLSRFKPGDRVVGHGVGMQTKCAAHSTFQSYTILQTNMASHIPDGISYESATVLPLGLSTAACGLFQDEFLKLQYPTLTGKTLLVWGGASSVGSNAIQLGVAAGYEVITTASPRNFNYVKRLGAVQVFDYNSPSAVDDIVTVLKGKSLAGAIDCIGFSSTPLTVDIVLQSEGQKFVSTVKGGFKAPAGVTVKMIFAPSLKDSNVGKAIYEDFLPKALKAGTFVPAPEPLLAGQGLESIQAAVDLMAKGNSARKVVVSL